MGEGTNYTQVLAALSRAGSEAAMDFFNGDATLLNAYLDDFKNGDKKTKQVAETVLEGAGYMLASIVEKTKINGYRLSPQPPSCARMRYLLAVSKDKFFGSEGFWMLVSAVGALQKSCSFLKASFDESAGQESTDPKREPKTPEKPTVQKIEIVGMPARETIVSVERDPDGEIARTKQREVDA